MAPSPVPFLDLRAAYLEIKQDIDAAVARTLDSGWYVLGNEVSAFEAEYAAYTESRHAVGVSDGLDALVLCLQALEVGPGDDVLVPANTYIATWLAVSQVGARPVPVEPVPGLWTIDPDRLEATLTPKTKAVMPVHLYGQPAELDPILAFARKRGLRVIEDAAQCHGARYRGRRIGAHGDAVAWSFYPSKNLGCFGDGGAVTTDDPALADRVRLLRNYGSRIRYANEIKGRNARLDEVQAAVLRVKLARLDAWNARREAVARLYRERLQGIPGLGLPRSCGHAPSVHHLFVVDHPERDRLQAGLKAAGVETLIHYPVPPHRSGAYAAGGFAEGAFPVTDAACRSHLSLPIGPHLKTEDAELVVEAVAAVVRPLIP